MQLKYPVVPCCAKLMRQSSGHYHTLDIMCFAAVDYDLSTLKLLLQLWTLYYTSNSNISNSHSLAADTGTYAEQKVQGLCCETQISFRTIIWINRAGHTDAICIGTCHTSRSDKCSSSYQSNMHRQVSHQQLCLDQWSNTLQSNVQRQVIHQQTLPMQLLKSKQTCTGKCHTSRFAQKLAGWGTLLLVPSILDAWHHLSRSGLLSASEIMSP